MNNRFNQEAALWDKDLQRVHMAESIADVMIEQLKLKPDQILMDYGAGTGLVTLKLQPYVRKVVAVDTSQGMLDALKEKLVLKKIENVELINGTYEDEAIHLPATDVIVSSMAFHHIQDTARVAHTFWAALKPSGQIAIADLDEDNGEFHADPNAAMHNGFNRLGLQKTFEQAGFKSIHFHEAYTVKKLVAGNREKSFLIFLMTAIKS